MRLGELEAGVDYAHVNKYGPATRYRLLSTDRYLKTNYRWRDALEIRDEDGKKVQVSGAERPNEAIKKGTHLLVREVRNDGSRMEGVYDRVTLIMPGQLHHTWTEYEAYEAKAAVAKVESDRRKAERSAAAQARFNRIQANLERLGYDPKSLRSYELSRDDLTISADLLADLLDRHVALAADHAAKGA